ncbi:MAG: 2-amino-4-hydroxy-6-hydroxymethyldihydropteridine diphosphokinase [Gemmatimonadaceae bacterium]
MPEVAFIALGANLGDRAAHLSAARSALTLVTGVALLAASRVEETAPLGSRVQGPYLNQMVAVATTLEPHALLARLQRIERQLGRMRAERWGARTIDLDVVRFGERRIVSPTLVLPHPGLPHRSFWQREVAELDRLLRVAA